MNFRRCLLLSCALLGTLASSQAKNETFFNAVVAKDGTGSYTSVQAAIDAAPSGRTSPWLIFVKNGAYEEQVIVPEDKPFIHLIGQDKARTIIHLTLNVGGEPKEKSDAAKNAYWASSVHNPQSPTYKYEGSVVMVKATDFFTENISYVNDYGVTAQNGPQALAMKLRNDRTTFHNCILRSFQDTWMTSTDDAHRLYVNGCWIEGAVDYFYGGGDALVEESTFYNVRSGSVIVAPCQTNAKYGYVFHNCTVDGNEQAANSTVTLGRPWHNTCKAVYINTLVKIPLAPEGWSNMGTIPGLFAEYNSVDSDCKPLDLTTRKTDYVTFDGRKGQSRSTISYVESLQYTYDNIVSGTDHWNPKAMIASLPFPKNIRQEKGRLTWDAVTGAIGYLLEMDGKIIGMPTAAQFTLKKKNKGGVVLVRAVNQYGSLGQASACYL